MHTRTKTLAIASATLLVSFQFGTAYGDSWAPIEQTEFYSVDRNYMLRIWPHPEWPDKPGHCQATLYSLKGDWEAKVWSRYLINNHAPVSVFVSDAGKYVVTMDEWGHIGQLPVVIYGARGRLVKAHSIDSLDLDDDVGHIQTTMSSCLWNEDSVSFFGPKEETFVIRLHWGRMLILDLSNGRVMNKGSHRFSRAIANEEAWRILLDFVAKQLRQRALAMLISMHPEDRKTGAMLSGQVMIREAIPRLRELLGDRSYYTTMGGAHEESTIVLYVREAARQALEKLGEETGPVLTELPEKGHLKYEERKGMYVVVFDDEDETQRKRDQRKPSKESQRGEGDRR